MADYNGWRNWETWLFALHLDADDQDGAMEIAAQYDNDYDAGAAIVEHYEDAAGDVVGGSNFLNDVVGGFFSAVDKREIGAHFRQDEGLTGPRKRSARKRTTRKRTTRKRRTTCAPRKRTTRKRTTRKRTTRRRR